MPLAASALVHFIHRSVGARPDGDPTDRELLQRFVVGHDQDAFAILVRRHGTLVWRVCRQHLSRVQDAEDVFQATFLVLARKAASVNWHESVAGWLHAVALRLALKSRSKTINDCGAARPEATVADPLEEITGRELLAALDEEVAALPEKYRLPLLLFYLEGRTQEETARQLRASLSSVRRNLERGRNLLHVRLTRRGLSLAASLGLLLLARQSASAVPATLAITAGRGGGSVCPSERRNLAANLSRGAMSRALNSAVVLVLALGSVVAGVVAMNGSAKGGREEEQPVAGGEPPPAEPAAEKSATDAVGDPLPPGALRRLGTVRLRHPTTLRSIAYSPDGKMLVSAGWDPMIHLWDSTSGKELRHIDGPEKGVDAIAISPDGKTLAGAGIDGTVYVWDAATGKEVRRLEGSKPGLHCVAFSPRGDLIAAGEEGPAVNSEVTGTRAPSRSSTTLLGLITSSSAWHSLRTAKRWRRRAAGIPRSASGR